MSCIPYRTGLLFHHSSVIELGQYLWLGCTAAWCVHCHLSHGVYHYIPARSLYIVFFFYSTKFVLSRQYRYRVFLLSFFRRRLFFVSVWKLHLLLQEICPFTSVWLRRLLNFQGVFFLIFLYQYEYITFSTIRFVLSHQCDYVFCFTINRVYPFVSAGIHRLLNHGIYFPHQCE